jgi:hypothetical protein
MLAIIAPLAAVIVIFLVESLTSSPAVARWRLCTLAGPKVVCTTACTPITKTFATFDECEAAKQTMRFPASNTKKAEKSAGVTGIAECKKRYGKNITNATISSDGKTLVCHETSNDPIVMRDPCKKRYGPIAQIRWHRGKIYCAAP